MALTFQTSFIGFVFILLINLASCSQQGQTDKRVLARINDLELHLEDFEMQLSQEVEFDSDFKVTPEAKMVFLEDLIKKELLVQEAKRLKLDREKRFMRTIQRHWETTLITNLLELRSRDIDRTVIVSEDDIITRYEDMIQTNPSMGPLSQYRDQIIAELKEEKKRAKLRHWTDELERKAHIEINEDLL